MVMAEAMKDKEKMMLGEFKEDEFGLKEVQWKKSIDSDEDFNEEFDEEDPVLR